MRINFRNKEEGLRFEEIEDKLMLDVWGHLKNGVEVVLPARDALSEFDYEVVHEDVLEHFESFFATNPVCKGGKEACIGGGKALADSG